LVLIFAISQFSFVFSLPSPFSVSSEKKKCALSRQEALGVTKADAEAKEEYKGKTLTDNAVLLMPCAACKLIGGHLCIVAAHESQQGLSSLLCTVVFRRFSAPFSDCLLLFWLVLLLHRLVLFC
jgi:hypothetical protein